MVDLYLERIHLDGVGLGVGDESDAEVFVGELRRAPASAPGVTHTTEGDDGVGGGEGWGELGILQV
jgi:hypothetical protein